MQLAAHWALLLALIAALFLSGLAAWRLFHRDATQPAWFESGQAVLVSLLTVVSGVLFVALWRRDFSFLYVVEYTDKVLPLFYAITAFWAGQAGSLLFWSWMTALVGLGFTCTKGYQRQGEETKLWFWLFYFAVQAFFLLLLTGPSSPFVAVAPAPADGKGLNPLLQNPGMIFHPPLLFLGYAGFTVPACLALAARLAGEPRSWIGSSRGITLVSWSFLTAGIVLGGWWSYMELGWGGYWAWDPVENASLIPWLTGTAFLHTAVVAERRGSLPKVNIFLVSLTFVLCLFGTYLVRSGVVESLHAFGEGDVSRPLLLSILFGLALTVAALVGGRSAKPARELDALFSLPGLLVLLAWLLCALAAVVLLGTMWPVISRLWSANTMGLDASFYNRVCNPLFAGAAVLLVLCPWMSWGEGVRKPRFAVSAILVMALAGALLWGFGYRQPTALVAASAALASLAGLAVLLTTSKAARSVSGGLGAWTLHAGLALTVLGVAISGPYQQTREAIITPGETMTVGGYNVTYVDLKQYATPGYAAGQAVLRVSRDGREVGVLTPERRTYRNFPQPFAEVSVLPSLGDEIYATLLAFSQDKGASFKVSVNPLVNWVWIGGALMCLAGLFASRRKASEER
ncbi:cytochrome c-type biogenesis CcmF C-terminal domain-containing protein [Fundidesulfovibrio butyratiphilus]